MLISSQSNTCVGKILIAIAKKSKPQLRTFSAKSSRWGFISRETVPAEEKPSALTQFEWKFWIRRPLSPAKVLPPKKSRTLMLFERSDLETILATVESRESTYCPKRLVPSELKFWTSQVSNSATVLPPKKRRTLILFEQSDLETILATVESRESTYCLKRLVSSELKFSISQLSNSAKVPVRQSYVSNLILRRSSRLSNPAKVLIARKG